MVAHLGAMLLAAALDAGAAERAFAELASLCAADAGRLWGRTVCGPTVIVDPQTREAVTWDGGAVATATLPESMPVANTAVEWNGRRWTMVMAPLPSNPIARRVLLAHESFHRIQPELGFTSSEMANAHLDGEEGRTLMRLEWRALARAVASSGEEARRAVEDALVFRARRRSLAPGAAAEERMLEMNEGLAEHTGVALAIRYPSERAPWIAGRLAAAESRPNFVRSFAYASGPAWGTLIERRDPAWTRAIRPTDDLGEIARRAWRLGESDPARADERAAAYGGEEVARDERSRAEQIRAEIASLRARLVDGPVLVIPLQAMQMAFDPNALRPLGDLGTVYRTIRVTDAWGTIDVTGGALVTADWTRLVVPVAEEGYTLALADGWRRAPGAREGDETLERTADARE